MWLQFSCIFQRRHKCEIHPPRTNRGKIGFDWVHICRFLHLWSNTEHTAVIVGIYLLVHKNSNQFRLQSASTCVWTNVSDYEYSKGSQGQVLRWCNTFHPTQCDSMDEWQIPWICWTSCHTLPANFLALTDCTVSLLQCYSFCWKKLWLNHSTKAGRGIVFLGPLPRVTTEKVKELHWWGGEEGDGGEWWIPRLKREWTDGHSLNGERRCCVKASDLAGMCLRFHQDMRRFWLKLGILWLFFC